MKRREILQYAALSTGTAVFGPLLSSFLSGCSTPAAEAGIDYTPAAFTQDQYMLARDMMDVILPSTDTPSATDVQVDVTIDQIVDKTYAPEARETYLAGFAALAAWMSGQDYMDSSAEEKKNILGSLESSDPTVPVDALTGYLHFKQFRGNMSHVSNCLMLEVKSGRYEYYG
ncbi:MAG: gluconate 2-dehydrogenase subunit 3 family protein [Cyclobacteriaceae bacterium]